MLWKLASCLRFVILNRAGPTALDPTAYAPGRRAYLGGMAKNPHPRSGPYRKAWQAGYDDALLNDPSNAW